jgi:uncharacterized protein with NRDE domain
VCTLVVLNEYIEGYPLIVAANRDDHYDRKCKLPKTFGDFIKSQDENEGTWIGIGRDGWFVCVINQDDGKHDAYAASRGSIVDECLRAENHYAAARIIKSLELERYNPFNIIFGRPRAMFLVRAFAGHELEMIPLELGINVISNDCWGRRYEKKCSWAKQFVLNTLDKPLIHGIDAVLRRLMIVMGSHHNATEEDPFQSLCVHAEKHAFGTRSTSIITVSNHMDVEYYYSEGHPCQSYVPTIVGNLSSRIINECTEYTSGRRIEESR